MRGVMAGSGGQDLSHCPQPGSRQAGRDAGAAPALAIRHLCWAGLHTCGHVCVLVAAILQHRGGSQQGRQVGTETRTKLPPLRTDMASARV